MQPTQKEMVRNAVRSYLSESSPSSLDEFEVVFDSAYESIASSNASAEEKGRTLGYEACSFDGGIASQAIVSMSCVVAFALIKGALKDSVRRDLPAALDRLEAQLSAATKSPELVKAIRERVEGILQNL